VKPATAPRSALGTERLLAIDPARNDFAHATIRDLPDQLRAGDLLVVNDAATLPASLRAAHEPLEVRLVRRGDSDAAWTAILLGEGDFRTPTEERGAARSLGLGETIDFGERLVATVVAVDPEIPTLVDLRFQVAPDRSDFESAAPSPESALLSAIYRRGHPIQYAYLERELPLFEFQNRFAARPWALEMPSAGHCLTWDLLFRMRARGIAVARVTHAAGISSTGCPALDRRLPLPERYEIAEDAVRAIAATKHSGGRVVAVGTTVVRALEAAHAEHGALIAGVGEARLVLAAGFRPRVVDGILSGMHEPATSHFALLEAFASRALLERALADASRTGYLQHEFGDTMLVLAS
jgi:S-adenosylmethionine:tRNA ribosyltransferase-isomerase